MRVFHNYTIEQLRDTLHQLGATVTPNSILNYSYPFCISGTLIIDNNFSITNLDSVFFSSGAKIIIDPNVIFDFHLSHLSAACDSMWDGIILSNSSSINFHNDTIEDAYEAIQCVNGNTINTAIGIEGCIFNNNYISIFLQNCLDPLIFLHSLIQSTPPLKYFSCYQNSTSKSGCGIYILDCDSVVVGSLINQNRNYFVDLNQGICAINSSINVRNNDFTNLTFYNYGTGTGCPYFEPGYGVFATNTSGSPLRTIRIGGTGNSENTFINCMTAIKTKTNLTVVILNDSIIRATKGIVSLNSKHTTVEISNNHLINVQYGIESGLNYQSNVGIRNNSILLDLIKNGFSIGIKAWSYNFHHKDSVTVIEGNSIHNAYQGIVVSWLGNPVIQDNGIKLTDSLNQWNDSIRDAVGIRVNSGRGAYVFHNYVNGNNQMMWNVKGIDMQYTAAAKVQCDSVAYCYWGICNRGHSGMQKWTANRMKDDSVGIALYEHSVIGPQGFSFLNTGVTNDNKWFGSFDAHTKTFISTQGNLSPFKLRSSNGNCLPIGMINSVAPPGQFISVTPLINVLNSLMTCSSTYEQISTPIVWLEAIALDSVDYYDGAEEYNWWGKMQLIEFLENNLSYLDSSDVLNAFYVEAIENDGKFISLLSDLIDATDSAAFNLALAEAQSLSPKNQQEENLQSITNVIAETVAQDNDDFDETQKETLYDIAIQCPFDGGPAVYLARNLYNFAIDSDQWFFDLNCLATTGLNRMNQTKEFENIKVYPTLLNQHSELFIESEFDGEIQIYDLSGKQLKSGIFSVGISVLKPELNSGIYFYTIRTTDGNLMNGKIIFLEN